MQQYVYAADMRNCNYIFYFRVTHVIIVACPILPCIYFTCFGTVIAASFYRTKPYLGTLHIVFPPLRSPTHAPTTLPPGTAPTPAKTPTPAPTPAAPFTSSHQPPPTPLPSEPIYIPVVPVLPSSIPFFNPVLSFSTSTTSSSQQQNLRTRT